MIDLPLASGERQRVLVVSPPRPSGALVMLPGGAGDVGIEPDGHLRHGRNFVVRTRDLWAARGYAVLIPDAIGGAGLRGRRSSPAYAAVVASLVALARRQSGGPVFLLGTSQGAIAAMNGAAHAEPGTLAGVVLTESVAVLGGSRETVFDADPAGVRVPALVVANTDDRCDVAPPSAAPKIAAAMSHAPSAEVLTVTGGSARSPTPCGSLTPHGYDGIEGHVVDAISRWMRSHG